MNHTISRLLRQLILIRMWINMIEIIHSNTNDLDSDRLYDLLVNILLEEAEELYTTDKSA